MGAIPIKNVYYLLLYAWDRFTPESQVDVGAEQSPDLPNLLARVLVEGTRRLLRRGLDKGYRGYVEELASPRGRFLLAETVKRRSLTRGRMACQFDELSPDVIHHRILKGALMALAKSNALENSLREDVIELRHELAGVTEVPLARRIFSQLQLSRSTAHYGLLMRICELLLELQLPEEGGHGSRFADVLSDKDKMPTIFEAFVRNSYRQEQDQFTVGSELIPWDTGPNPLEDENYLPSMRTDVTLRSCSRTIVIDAKFYPQVLVSHLGGHQKVRSAHLYQLISYLKNTAHKGGLDTFAEGILLYPCTDTTKLRLNFSLLGHRVRACSIDLTRPWQAIHNEMMGLLQDDVSTVIRRGRS
jgi:5-methylcytosine-specific restriction enzyme subunit McrC